jgi:hypothetical protein
MHSKAGLVFNKVSGLCLLFVFVFLGISIAPAISGPCPTYSCSTVTREQP